MKDKNVVLWPDPILSKRSLEVTDFSNMPDLIDYLKQTMKAQNALGISAVQIGELKRVFVMGDKEFINPKILECSEEKVRMDEACLSFPGVVVSVERPACVTLKYQNLNKTEIVEELKGLDARCALHEIDHLNGDVFIKYASRVYRNIIKAKYRRL